MPIRFRCAYCNQLMAISRRKAGTVVRCPKCAGEIVVPAPDGVPEAADDVRGCLSTTLWTMTSFDAYLDEPRRPKARGSDAPDSGYRHVERALFQRDIPVSAGSIQAQRRCSCR